MPRRDAAPFTSRWTIDCSRLRPRSQGIRVSPAAPVGAECWAKPLADGSVAAMLLNRSPAAATVSCSWAEIGLPHPAAAATVRDLWQRKDLGSFTGAYAATVPSHGAVVVKVAQAAAAAGVHVA